MIKTYKARVSNNNVSYLLEGKQGNKVRYNFTNGNVVINKYPSLTLRNRYCQDLLESNPLFLTTPSFSSTPRRNTRASRLLLIRRSKKLGRRTMPFLKSGDFRKRHR